MTACRIASHQATTGQASTRQATSASASSRPRSPRESTTHLWHCWTDTAPPLAGVPLSRQPQRPRSERQRACAGAAKAHAADRHTTTPPDPTRQFEPNGPHAPNRGRHRHRTPREAGRQTRAASNRTHPPLGATAPVSPQRGETRPPTSRQRSGGPQLGPPGPTRGRHPDRAPGGAPRHPPTRPHGSCASNVPNGNTHPRGGHPNPGSLRRGQRGSAATEVVRRLRPDHQTNEASGLAGGQRASAASEVVPGLPDAGDPYENKPHTQGGVPNVASLRFRRSTRCIRSSVTQTL